MDPTLSAAVASILGNIGAQNDLSSTIDRITDLEHRLQFLVEEKHPQIVMPEDASEDTRYLADEVKRMKLTVPGGIERSVRLMMDAQTEELVTMVTFFCGVIVVFVLYCFYNLLIATLRRYMRSEFRTILKECVAEAIEESGIRGPARAITRAQPEHARRASSTATLTEATTEEEQQQQQEEEEEEDLQQVTVTPMSRVSSRAFSGISRHSTGEIVRVR